MRKWRAERCDCGECEHWHVHPVASIHGVKFTESEAKAIVALAGALDQAEEQDPNHNRKDKIRACLDVLDGKGPGGQLNHGYADGYYALSIERRFGKDLEELRKEVEA
jgi:hypothetical protein